MKTGGIRHKGISKCQETRGITEFFGEDIGEIVKAGNVLNGNSFSENIFPYKIFPKINPFHFLGGRTFSPLDRTLIVIIEGYSRLDWKVDVTKKKF